MSIAKKIQARLEKGSSLFYFTSALTLIYWAILIARFVTGENLAFVPEDLSPIYLAVLSAYVGVNLTETISPGKIKKRPGQVFFYGWGVLTVIIITLVAFHIHGEEEIIGLLWPYPLGPIIGIFWGSKAIKRALKKSESATPSRNE